ncbi:MAG: arylsulfatase [Planctomycetes bacterium]|nr:arylsulfatase [Planctomycetota bacterium]
MFSSIGRRDLLKLTGASVAGVMVGTFQEEAFAFGGEKPNIIFIMADDLGYADLGCYGQKFIKTPYVDRMAREGLMFTQCYTGAAVCAPSRSVLMTGQHTGHTRIRGNKGVNTPPHNGQNGRIPLRPEDFTVAKLLQNAGYRTAITGKWGLGEPGSTGLPNDHGFDEWLGYLNQDHAPDYFTDFLWQNKKKQLIPENAGKKRRVYSHDLFTEFALDFIRKNKNNPFFLYVPYCIPHAKLEVPDLESYADKDWPEDAKIFAAMVTRMDRDVGRILDLVDELGIEEKTIVFFCSDNGSARVWRGLFNSCGPLRENKGSVYEGGIRTPMIVRCPGKVPEGRTSKAVWYFADFLPAAAELAGVRPPENIDGISVVDVFFSVEPSKRLARKLRNRFLYWEAHGKNEFRQAVRHGDWKAVRHGHGKTLELYDLSKDIGETTDKATQYPEIVAKIGKYLDMCRTDSIHWPLPESKG